LAEAKKVSDASAQKTAVEACKAVKSGNAGALKAAAKKECLAVSAKVPNGPARQQAEAACNKATK
jgi:hypothetical protein